MVEYMSEKAAKSLCRHFGFYAAASLGFYQVNEVVDGHFPCNLGRPSVGVVAKQSPEFCEVISDGHFAVIAQAKQVGSTFEGIYGPLR